MIEVDMHYQELRPRISIIGVGGAGSNAVDSMIRHDVRGVDFIAVNTDAQSLKTSLADRTIQLGRTTTQGLGAGSCAERGRIAAEESFAEIDALLEGVHMCFITAGLGGGTGTGAAPVIARAARARGILTVGVVTKPFDFEGKRRARMADSGLEALSEHVDTLIVIPNQNLFRIANPETTFKAAFDLADDVLQLGVRGITDLMVMPGFINLDFADIRTVMNNRGRAMMGSGEAGGDDRALRAAEAAIANPLLDEAVKGARGLIISISGGDDMRLMEVDQAAAHIKDLVDPDADIIWGSAFNPELEGRIRVSLVATGIGEDVMQSAPSAQPASEAVHRVGTPAPAAVAIPVRAPIMAQPPITARLPEAVQLALAIGPTASEPRSDVPGPTVHHAVSDRTAEEELLLTVERKLILVPPTEAAMAAATAVARRQVEKLYSPSLFERMAGAARDALARAANSESVPLQHIHRGPRLASERSGRFSDQPGVYRRHQAAVG